jgi:hypothetical protein
VRTEYLSSKFTLGMSQSGSSEKKKKKKKSSSSDSENAEGLDSVTKTNGEFMADRRCFLNPFILLLNFYVGVKSSSKSPLMSSNGGEASATKKKNVKFVLEKNCGIGNGYFYFFILRMDC